jgi:PST family polysaccharide transporter
VTAAAAADQHPAPASLARASVWTLAASLAAFGLAVVQAKVSAIVLGPSGVGVLANLSGLLPVISTVAFAVAGQGALREIAVARARGDTDQLRAMLRYTTLAPLAFGIAATAVTLAVAPAVSQLLLGDASHAGLLMVATLAVPAMLVAASWQAALQGLSQIALAARASIVGTAVGTGSLLLLIVWAGLPGAIAGLVVSAVLQAAVFIAFAPSIAVSARRAHGLPRRLGTVAQFGAASIGLLIASQTAAVLIRGEIARHLGLDAAGLYQPISAVSDTYLELLIGSTAVYLFPRLTELLARDDRGAAGAEIGSGLRFLLLPTTPLLILAITFSEALLAGLYAPAFVAAGRAFDAQMVGNVAKVIAWSVGAALLPGGHVRAWLLIGLVTVTLRYLLVRLFIDDLGLLATAIAYNAAWTWSALAVTFYVVRVARIPLSREDVMAVIVAASTVIALTTAKLAVPVFAVPIGIAALVVWSALIRPGRAVAELRHALLRP